MKNSFKVAVIEVGTNSIKFHLALKDKYNVWSIIDEKLIVTRLGEGLYKNKSLKRNAIERTISAISNLLEIAKEYNAEHIEVIGTEALRSAKNRSCFLESLKSACGIEIEILSEREEGIYSFLGCINNLNLDSNNSLVFDIGGGSTELINITDGKIQVDSIRIGAVSLTEEFLRTDPAKEEEIINMREFIRSKLNPLNLKEFDHLVGVGGTITSIGTIYKKIDSEHIKEVHGIVVSLKEIKNIFRHLSSINYSKRLDITGLHPKRAGVIVAGIAIAVEILEFLHATNMIVSIFGLRHGLILKKYDGFYNK